MVFETSHQQREKNGFFPLFNQLPLDVCPVPNLYFPAFVLYGFVQDLVGQNT